MFNVKVKQEYINYNPNNNHQFHKIMTNYFDRAEETERRLNKDLAQFTSAEIISMYKSFLTPSFNMLVIINNQFLNYTTWYKKEIGIGDNQNHYIEIRDDILMNCVSYTAQRSSIMKREEFLDMIKEFQNPYESFLYLALFEGLGGERMSDFYDLSMKDFDRRKLIVRLPKRTLTISKELYHYAEESANEYIIYNIMGEPTRRGRLLETDNRIIKCSSSSGFETEKSERAGIVYRMLRKTKRYDFVPESLNATNIIESGRVNMINEFIDKKGFEGADLVIKAEREEIEARYGHIPSVPKWLLKYGSFCRGV